MILHIENINKSFGGVQALDGITLDIKKNTLTGLIGPNGSGKTSLINVISGFIKPDNGRIIFHEKDITSKKPYEIARMGICRTFQISRMFRKMTVLECMLLASKAEDDGLLKLFTRGKEIHAAENRDIEKARTILESLQIGHLSNEYSGSISIGQQKLLSIAMMQMAEPELVLLDEPVAGVNPTLANQIFDNIQREKEKTTFLIVEHNVDILMNFCDRIFVMNKGKIVASGTPHEIRCNEKVIDIYLGG